MHYIFIVNIFRVTQVDTTFIKLVNMSMRSGGMYDLLCITRANDHELGLGI